jgi:hypothetical protein
VIFVVEKATPKQHAALRKNKWPRAQWKKDKAEKLKPLLQLLKLQNKNIVLVKKMRMTRTKRLL